MSAHAAPRTGTRVGPLSASYALFALALGAASAWIAADYESLLVHAVIDHGFALRTGIALAVALTLELLLGAAVLRAQARRQRHTPGRGRFMALASGGMAHALGSSAAGALVLHYAKGADLAAGFGLTLPRAANSAFVVCAAAGAAGLCTMLLAALSTWQLLAPNARTRIWVVVDAVLLVAAAYAIAVLPSQPPSDAPHALLLPIERHAVTTAFALRLLIRLLPPVMNLVERTGFRSLVAARHLRSKKSGFLAAISLLSIMAVTVSSCALTTTLSVMGGFRNDLKRKILGNNAHIVIDRDHASIEAWAPLVKAATDNPEVIGASPYVSGEVMLSSASNLATAVLRGVDPSGVGKVNDLPRNLKTGSLDYLDHPEKLLDLPPDTATSLFKLPDGFATRSGESKAHKPKHDDAQLPTDDSVLSPEGKKAKIAELEKKLDDLDAFLRKDRAAANAPRSHEVLPGIVIGQELARALRLYLGDEVNVVAPLGALGPSGPMPKARPFRVAGIFYSGMYEYDMKFTYVSLDTAQRFLNVGHAVSGIEIKVKNVDTAPATATALRRALARPELRVRDWQELNSRLFGALALEKLAMFIALGIAILVASFCIAGTLTLMVQEKGREVAILKAMGTSDRSVVGVFVIEGGLIGVLGASLGIFLGYMMCFAAEHFGIRMNPEVYYIDRLPVHMDPTEFMLTGLAAIGVCLLVTIYPALMASRLRPVDALRYE
jgi:lipoprotein-releasing system permease protein